jgi:hypothetical protein
MNRNRLSRRFFRNCRNVLAWLVLPVGVAVAQDRFESPLVQAVVPAPRPIGVSPGPAKLGTFEPTPYIMVRSNWPAGGGYSSLEFYGDQSLSLYGPLSQLRAVAAPVMTYTRGYDGRVYASPATSFSTPNLPELTPVVYPTSASYYYAPRVNRTPPQWTSGFNWIDQN